MMLEGFRFFEYLVYLDWQILIEKRGIVNRLLMCEWVGVWRGGGGGWFKIIRF